MHNMYINIIFASVSLQRFNSLLDAQVVLALVLSFLVFDSYV